jgi:MtN3 and saliva related transmembrane protein
MMEFITLLGLFAGFLTTVSSIPQVIKTWKTKKAKDISALWIILMICGTALWLAYGLYINDLPLIAANSITTLLLSALLAMKWKFG